jgi:hypothetical protein
MKRLLVLAVLVGAVAYAAPNVTPELAAHLDGIGATELVRVLVVMEEQTG